jgi:hypothetical protein
MNDSHPKGSAAVHPDYFVVQKHNFDDLVFNPALQENLRHIFNKATNSPVKQFVLYEKPSLDYCCQVTLIERGRKFTPRLTFSIRDKTGTLQAQRQTDPGMYELKSRVSLEECHENFWLLISFLQSLRGIEVPDMRFSVVSMDDADLVAEISNSRNPQRLTSIAKALAEHGLPLSQEDVNELLRRRERLQEFERGLTEQEGVESWWQDFFERNKWIFGYGLNYQIMRQQQEQPHLGGTRVDRTGGKKGDYLMSTSGDVGFTVVVEIKTPDTHLISGSKEIRAGAWSLSRDLADALSQIQANIVSWQESAGQRENIDMLERSDVYTVQPKGIIVIGRLRELKENRSKRDTFERFRKGIHGVEILTFDELFKRARYIAEQKE